MVIPRKMLTFAMQLENKVASYIINQLKVYDYGKVRFYQDVE